jgi:pimeloyl-ACP methyl ester carboxylesterase
MDIDFSDTGNGPALLFLPGSYSTMSVWKGVQAALTGSYRRISTSLPGYGGTGEIRPPEVADMKLMVEFVAHVADRIGEPFHLVGHSFGGLTALAATMMGAVRPLSLITFEGNPVYVRPDSGEFDWQPQVLETGEVFERAYAAGDPDAAKIIIDYWGQEGFFAAMPDPVRDYCRASTYTNILDWRAAAGFTPQISDFSVIESPSTLVRGEQANDAIVDVTGLLAKTMPQSNMRVVDGAGHFLISTHPEQCARIIDQHMAQF